MVVFKSINKNKIKITLHRTYRGTINGINVLILTAC